jgi:hypothetical protein
MFDAFSHLLFTVLELPTFIDRMQGVDAKKYSSTLDCFRQIMLKDGVAGFYK